jgi:trehalose synthase
MSGHGIREYEPIIGTQRVNQLYRLAGGLSHLHFVHVNSTRTGGGVAEILTQLVPLFGSLGLEARWEVAEGTPDFFDVTKRMHNGLQGQVVPFTERDMNCYRMTNTYNRKLLDLEAEVVIIHDPQPAALIEARRAEQVWIWRCHIDLSHPHRRIWRFLRRYVVSFDGSIFSLPSFVQRLPIPQFLMPPSIDPLSDKNLELPEGEIEETLYALGIPRDKPLLLQVSRFDRFKDPLGVIRAYQMVKKNIDCRLVLAGGPATDDPEGEAVLSEVMDRAAGDPDIHVLLLPPDSNRTINALQRAADIILQKSIKEGFGLTVAEAMWKGKPVIGGAAGGITLQIRDGHNGFLVHSVEGAAYRVRYLLHRPELRRRMGELAREHVRQHFLLTRNLRDYLTLTYALLNPSADVVHLEAPRRPPAWV